MMHCLGAERKILICKRGLEIRSLSHFAPGINVFNRMMEGNNCSWFLPEDQPFEAGESGRLVHQGWDDFAPWMSSAYGFVGANHGSPYTFRVSMLRHWFTPKDLGKVLTDEKGVPFVIVALENPSSFLIHGRKLAAAEEGVLFPQEVSGSLYDGNVKIEADSIKKVQMGGSRCLQLSPQYRYNTFTLFADGRELEDDEICLCESAQLFWDFDLILSDTHVAYMEQHPGQYVSPVAAELASAVNHKLEVTFLPDCAWHYKVQATVRRDLPGNWEWGLLQHYGTLFFSDHEKLIPKLKPLTLESGKTADLDTPVKVSQPTDLCCRCTGADCVDPADPPDRYIDLFGDGGKREFGVVLSYSLTQGITRKGAGERGDLNCVLPVTTKIYPYAVQRPDGLRQGETFELHACRQYFLPGETATACYGRQESDGYWLYGEYHKAGEERIKLPKELGGKSFEIAERSGEISFSPEKHLEEDGSLTVTSSSARGSFALRIV